MTPTVFPDPESLGAALAARIADGIAAASAGRRPYVLGCPGGRSLLTTYHALADEVRARRLPLGHLVVAMMDEYAEPQPDGTFRHVDPSAAHSCVRFGRDEILRRLNAAALGTGINPDRFLVPDPADPAAFDRRIAELGGVELFLLASGAGDGHIAFNPAGTHRDAPTRVVALAEQTRRDNLATFAGFGGRLENVPRHGVTVGTGTIRAQSHSVVMVAHGAHKAEAVRRLTAAEHYEPDWPATVVTECADPLLYVDLAAARS
ncbi:6-phosphogluconolactonase [Streptomyces meridianus]|uniref:6-phosphogluconolactonase n=1 Tax=Streptomyces meridianus TaxID=2938945 RepID=A0ABT0X645_9ACTN|nr:6-phosphogluconolactonase [Streptomyces meridianus]MCM2577157.1 6-phosphogluconolactonase [Streptomyces meridianus]